MLSLFYLIFIGFFLISISWFYRINYSYKWLRTERNYSLQQLSFIKRKVFILIPVLDEINRIQKAVEYFNKSFKYDYLKIVLITTNNEFIELKKKNERIIKKVSKMKNTRDIILYIKKMNIAEIQIDLNDTKISIIHKLTRFLLNRKNTIDIARELEKNNNKVIVINYPRYGGKMAHQLNYAIRNIIDEGIDDNSLFCVYNADSRPEPQTLLYVLKKLDNEHRVFQQYGNYLNNSFALNGFIRGSILKSAAIWQTRWSIGFEIFNALKQFRFKNNSMSFNYPLNYCVGHGLFFTKSIFDNFIFNEYTHNEDAIFGMELSYNREFINPIPYFDLSDTPDTLRSLYLQKASWYFGPIQSFVYYRQILNKLDIKDIREKLKLFILASKLFSHAIYWFLGPVFLFLSFIVCLWSLNIVWWIFFIFEIILFLILPNISITMILSKLKNKKMELLIKDIFLGSLFCYAMHGLSACRTLIQIFFCGIFSVPIQKHKTEMVR